MPEFNPLILFTRIQLFHSSVHLGFPVWWVVLGPCGERWPTPWLLLSPALPWAACTDSWLRRSLQHQAEELPALAGRTPGSARLPHRTSGRWWRPDESERPGPPLSQLLGRGSVTDNLSCCVYIVWNIWMCVLYVIPPSSFGSENWISETSGGAKPKKPILMSTNVNLHLIIYAKREQKSINRNQ